ncbi:MAG TPA: histidine kinase [Miltoncostaeaceae bacterium]|nr:histidine kinase [Miltoncostaeaceae bacterium]
MSARAPHPLLLAALALAGAALCAFSIRVATNEGVADIQVALLQWISVPYIAAGLIAWWRRPESRLGVLMVAVGFSTGLLCLQFVQNEVLWSIGSSLDIFAAAAFVHVTLAFPSGRLRSTRERVVVGSGYAVAFGLQIAKLMFLGSVPQNGFAVTDDVDISRTIERVQLYSTSVICLAAAAMLLGRWVATGRPRRLWPSLLTQVFVVGLVGLALLYVFAAAGWPYFVEVQRTALVIIGFTPVLFLAGVLDARLARSGVSDLVVRLRGNPDAAEVQGALARALRDPTLQLVYWLPEFGSYADADGHEVALPEPGDARAMTPIQHDGVRIAALLHHPALSEERELMAGATAAAAIALENTRLQVELRARLEELRGSRMRIVEVAQDERKRLERNLHDGAQQRLVALSMELGRMESRLPQDAPERADLARARGEIASSLHELRQVARGLHPAVVSSHGLEIALEQLAATAPVPVTLSVRVGRRLPEALEVAAYYLVSESLANIGKHAHASSVRVEVLRQGDAVLIEVADDGVGGADTEKGSGLRGLADRVEALGGRLRVWSPAGGGTRVSAEIPCVP